MFHYLEEARELFPGGWTSFDIDLYSTRMTNIETVEAGERFACAVRIFTVDGYADYPFVISVGES